MPQQPIDIELGTERLLLRQWRRDDFEPLAAFLADENLNRYRGGPLSRLAAWDFLNARAGEWRIRGYGIFVIVEKATSLASGYTGLWHPFDLDEPELAWGLYSAAHGKGYATEAADAVRHWAHEALGLGPLMSFIHPENRASAAVAIRLGATDSGPTELRGEPRRLYRHVLPPERQVRQAG